MDVKKLATEYHEKGFNCAQSVLCACGEYTGLDEKTALAVSGGFGGGLRCGEVCGAVSGAVMVMGMCCQYNNASDAETKEKIAELTALLGLDRMLSKKAGKLSGGWQRRLSIAMALISEPKILFLDEPTLGLDVLARSELWDIIKALKGKVTIILTTHYMEEAEALSDRIAIMKDGKLLICANADEIKAQAGTDRFEEAFVRIVKGGVV